MDIKPIETVYNGYRFRSRLEARWAVFLDAIEMDYEYEPEGFDLGDGVWYLPDFYLPETKTWTEIKGEGLSKADHEKLLRFCYAKCDIIKTGVKFRLLVGQIPNTLTNYGEGVSGIQCYNYMSPAELLIPSAYDMYENGVFANAFWVPPRPTNIVMQGLAKARKARFEYGECG